MESTSFKKYAWSILILVVSLSIISCSKTGPSTNVPPAPTEIPIDMGPVPHPTPSPFVTVASAATPVNPSNPVETPSEPDISGAEPTQYVLENLKGTVEILPVGADQAQIAEEEETVTEGDEIITKPGAEASLTLNETTMFHLSSNSDVKIEELKSNDTGGFLSRLELLEGNVLSEVEKLSESRSTYEVDSGGVVCGVRGTSFEVQKEGDSISTNTFHGVVEMRNGSSVQRIESGHHGAFSFTRNAFASLRTLSPAEKSRYKSWLAIKKVVQRKQAKRLHVLQSLSRLSSADRAKLAAHLKTMDRRDRLKAMHEWLQKGPHQHLAKTYDHKMGESRHEIISRHKGHHESKPEIVRYSNGPSKSVSAKNNHSKTIPKHKPNPHITKSSKPSPIAKKPSTSKKALPKHENIKKKHPHDQP